MSKVQQLSKTDIVISKRKINRWQTQLLVAIVVFFATIFISTTSVFFSSTIYISPDALVTFFQTISQSLAAIIGFLFVFLALALQFVGLERSRMFDYFRDKVESLNSISRTCPDEMADAKGALLELSNMLEDFTKEKIIVTPDDMKTRFLPIAKEIRMVENEANSIEATLFVQEIYSIIVTIEETFSRDRGAYVGSVFLPVDFTLFPKLLVMFLISIVLSLMFDTVDVNNRFPDINIPILASFLAYFGLLIYEMYVVIRRTFNSLVLWK